LVKDGPEVFVRDSIGAAGAGSRELTWRFHLAPSVAAEIRGGDVRLAAGGRDVWLQFARSIDGLTATIEGGWVSPSYGVRTEIRVLVLSGRVSLPRVVSYRFGLARLPLDRLERAFDALTVGVSPCVSIG
jgi:hypothetical protein